MLLGLLVELVDDVPEQVEWRRPGVPKQVVVPLVGLDERVDRLPARAGDDVALGPKRFEEGLCGSLIQSTLFVCNAASMRTHDEVLARLAAATALLLGSALAGVVSFLLGLA